MSLRTRLGCLLSVVLLLTPVLPADAAPVRPQVHHLKTNSLTDPLGVPGAAPRLSWQLSSARRGTAQTSYQVRVTAPGQVWDSGRVRSDQSVDVVYGGPALTPYTSYRWTVRVWDDRGTASAWAPAATFETGALQPGDWQGDWIGADSQPGPEPPRARAS